jgi:hypothetical protein
MDMDGWMDGWIDVMDGWNEWIWMDKWMDRLNRRAQEIIDVRNRLNRPLL